ncbi:MAG: S8 family serine peptidase [Elusimicrobia bacterium]|nr:S8 family serine peptidase [Elusimicrobiota bacterium]
MKRILSAAVSLSLLALSLGPAAPQAAAAMARAAGAGTTSLALPAVPKLAPGIGVGINVPALGSSLLAPGLQAPAANPGALTQALMQAPDGAPTPFALSMQALAAPAPEIEGLAARETAEKDFQARIGGGAPAAGDEEVELLVSAPEGSGRQMTESVYPAAFEIPGLGLQETQTAMNVQLGILGVSPALLAQHGVKAIGAVDVINTAVLRAPADQAAAVMSRLQAQGLAVQVSRKFEVPAPQAAEPAARTVGLKEMNRIIGADKLQAELAKVLGEPSRPATFFRGVKAWLGKALNLAVENPVLPWANLDTFVYAEHPYMKGRIEKAVANDTDDQEHGSHTFSTVISVDRWNNNGRVYNIFPGGSASEGDILLKVDMAVKDGALATANSWGDNSGNPEGKIEQLFIKTAAMGVHHSISAGNSGQYGKNTIGGPAIAYHNVDLVLNGKVVGQARRMNSIAASDSEKKTAYFSSQGPGSRTTSRNPEKYKDYPKQFPSRSALGHKLVAAAPKGAGSYVEELGGPGQEMSGTSMSQPGNMGSLLLLTRAILVLLKDYLPAQGQKQLAMDLATFALNQTAEKVDVPDRVGDGFINVWAAYEYAAKALKDNAPAKVLPKVKSFLRSLLA